MAKDKKKALKSIRSSRIIYPLIIGLGVIGYMVAKEFDPNALSYLKITWRGVFWLFVAVLLMLSRDIGYVIRLKILSDKKLSWWQSIRIVFLWEFASAITPSAIGGTSVAIIFIHKEGLNIGKSAAVVMATSLLDELYFIIFFPLLLLILTPAELFNIDTLENYSYLNSFFLFAIIGYSVKLLWVIAVSYGLFVNPKGLRRLILLVFRLPIIRKWRNSARAAGNDIIKSSKELKAKPFKFWLKAFGATVLSWTSRYWIVNALFLAFFLVKGHVIIFARQLVMWIMMLVSPTPGGSGFSEYVFKEYLAEFIEVPADHLPFIIIALALIWRLISYYPYLIIGAFIFPKWVSKRFNNTKK